MIFPKNCSFLFTLNIHLKVWECFVTFSLSSFNWNNGQLTDMLQLVPREPRCWSSVASLVEYFRVLEPLESGAQMKEVGCWECALKGMLDPQASFLSGCFLATMKWADLLHHISPHHLPPCTRPQSNGVNLPWTETFGSMSQNRPFLLYKSLPQVFCHSSTRLTNILGFLKGSFPIFLWNSKTGWHQNTVHENVIDF